MKIALVEDDKMTSEYIKDIIKSQGYEVDVFFDGETALENLKKNVYKIIILDINLPSMNGFDVCFFINKYPEKYGMPKILMLTERQNQDDVNKGLKSGANEYIKKPFDRTEFILRLNNLIETTTNLKVEKVLYKGLVIDFNQSCIIENEKTINLTKREAEMLQFFILNTGLILSKEKIYNQIWDDYFMPGNKNVEIHIVKLKKKVKILQENIENVKGVGYRLKE